MNFIASQTYPMPEMSKSKSGSRLLLIPAPGMGHLVPAVELAKQLVAREPRLSITTLVIHSPLPDHSFESYLLSLKTDPSLTNQAITFTDLPQIDDHNKLDPKCVGFFSFYMESCKSGVKRAVERLRSESTAPLAGVVVDMFCSAIIDVAAELSLPSYVFYPSGASLLSMMFHLEQLGVDKTTEYDTQPPDTAVEFPGFRNPVPVKLWPRDFLEKDGTAAAFLLHPTRYHRAKGILVNTFSDLESDFITSMSADDRIPPIYPVGPIINFSPPDDGETADKIFLWLDGQPRGSVVFLCFGSKLGFGHKQVKEIAAGLELAGCRFLWSLRQQSSIDSQLAASLEVNDYGHVLPEGFMERTAEKGRVVGWVPQTRVLGHVAIGAFVSHCGWNSTLESVWFGVPMATWPTFADQHLNAFVVAREAGLAAEITMHYRKSLKEEKVVGAAEVAEGIRRVMEGEGAAAIGKKMKEMGEMARKATVVGGSSYESMDRFIEGAFENLG